MQPWGGLSPVQFDVAVSCHLVQAVQGSYLSVLATPLSNCLVAIGATLTLVLVSSWCVQVAEDIADGMEESNAQFVHTSLITLRLLCASRLRLVAVLCRQLANLSSHSSDLCTTPKVHKLQELLFRQTPSKRPLRGLIFVERRYMAVGLAALIRELGRRNEEFGTKIKCGFLTGTDTTML